MILKTSTSPSYRHLTDEVLLEETSKAASHEKEATLALLESLAEVDRRKAYATKSCSSLHDFVVRKLGYSEFQSSERVNAVRLMRSNEVVKSHLEEGALTLTTASQIQRFVQTERKATGKKFEVHPLIQKCLHQSKREVEKILFKAASVPTRLIMKESARVISVDRTELKFSIPDATKSKLDRVKEILGSKSLEEIFDQALDTLIAKEEKKRGMEEQKSTFPGKESRKTVEGLTPPSPSKNTSRYIPISYRRALSHRSGGQCEYREEATGARCKSRSRLQIDHRKPLALGGETKLENLRHLCPNHNARAAREAGLQRKELNRFLVC